MSNTLEIYCMKNSTPFSTLLEWPVTLLFALFIVISGMCVAAVLSALIVLACPLLFLPWMSKKIWDSRTAELIRLFFERHDRLVSGLAACFSTVLLICSVLVAHDALKQSRRDHAADAISKIRKDADELKLCVGAEIKNETGLRVIVPDGFFVADGVLYLPHFDSGEAFRDFRVFYPETHVDLHLPLLAYQAQLKEIISEQLATKCGLKFDHCLIKIPVVAKFRYTKMGHAQQTWDYYDLICNVMWENTPKNPSVRLQRIGLGYWKPVPVAASPKSSSDELANRMWETRKSEFRHKLCKNSEQ
jgi:hypothetical protein